MNLREILRGLSAPQLIIASVVLVSFAAFASERLKRALALSPHRVRHRGEVYRMLTGGWVHADFAHLLMNMFVLYLFADRVLRVFGVPLFVALYVSAVIIAYLPTTIRYRNRPEYASLGASGAVAAVMLSAILLHPELQLRLLFVPVPIPGIVFGLLYLLYSVWHSAGSEDSINHDAHFSGAAYGAIATYAWAPAKVEQTLAVLRRFVGW